MYIDSYMYRYLSCVICMYTFTYSTEYSGVEDMDMDMDMDMSGPRSPSFPFLSLLYKYNAVAVRQDMYDGVYKYIYTRWIAQVLAAALSSSTRLPSLLPMYVHRYVF